MTLLAKFIGWLRAHGVSRHRSPEDGLSVDTERMRRRRELARYQGQVGDNLTVQTTIDMARTQTWTGGGVVLMLLAIRFLISYIAPNHNGEAIDV